MLTFDTWMEILQGRKTAWDSPPILHHVTMVKISRMIGSDTEDDENNNCRRGASNAHKSKYNNEVT